MFNKEHGTAEIDIKDAETIIGPSIKIKGNFHGEGNMIIEGIVDGSVKTAKHLLIGDKAKVTANVEAKQVKVGGEVNGNLRVRGYIEITSTAKILGDIAAAEISIERGAVVNGKIEMTKHGHQEEHKREDN